MAKKQKSFADKAAGSSDKDVVYVKYVNSIRSEKTGHWRFNEQMIKTKKGEQLDVALKRLDEVANMSDIDLTAFSKVDLDKKEELEESKVKADSESKDVKVETSQDKKEESDTSKTETKSEEANS